MTEPSAAVLDLYKLAVEMSDRVSARRATANSFFLALQTGLVAVLAAFAGSSLSSDHDKVVLMATAVAGALIAAAWWLLLRSYRHLNRAKFQVITQIETDHLPLQIFGEEWRALKAEPETVKRWRERYAELGDAERVVPLVFAALYLGLGVYVVLR